MSKDKTKLILESFLKLANSPDEFIIEHNKKADGLLTISFLLLCFPAYELVRGQEVSIIHILIITFGAFFMGYAAVLRLSSKSMKVLSKYIDVNAINKDLNGKGT